MYHSNTIVNIMIAVNVAYKKYKFVLLRMFVSSRGTLVEKWLFIYELRVSSIKISVWSQRKPLQDFINSQKEQVIFYLIICCIRG